MRSLISNDRLCYVCRTPLGLHRHHIYGGANRTLSEKYGCWVFLCGRHHNMSNEGVHFDKALDQSLKMEAQRRFQDAYPDKDFIQVFGRNYL